MTEPVWLDGTQDPPPQPTLPDPLAGLLTGELMPDEVPASRQVVVAAPPPVPAATTAISEVFAEPPQPRATRPQARRPGPQFRRPAGGPAGGYRPRPAVRQRPPNAKPGVTLITWLVTLFILFLIARAVIASVTGN